MKKIAKKAPLERVGAEADSKFSGVMDAFAKDKDVSCGKMFGSVGLKVNGKVFAMLVKDRFVTKLPKERVDQLVTADQGEYFDPGQGRLMKEWVAIAAEKMSWVDLAKEAHRFVKGGRS